MSSTCIWDLFRSGALGSMRLGMPISSTLKAFGEPDNYATNAGGDLSMLKYGEIELHFPHRVLCLIHSEIQINGSSSVSFSNPQLGLKPEECLLPMELSNIEVTAKERGLSVASSHDALGNPQLKIGFAEITEAKDVLVVSVLDRYQ